MAFHARNIVFCNNERGKTSGSSDILRYYFRNIFTVGNFYRVEEFFAFLNTEITADRQWLVETYNSSEC